MRMPNVLGRFSFNEVISAVIFLIILPLNSYCWESQLFPYSGALGKYTEVTATYNSRDWKLLDYSYTGYNLSETPLQHNIPCNVLTVAGTGDITQELQDKINAVGSAGGGIVKIPAGNYTITQTLAGKPIAINNSNVSIEGAGSGYTFINVPATHAYEDNSNTFEGVFTFEKGNFAWNKGWVEDGTVLSNVTNTISEGDTYITGLTNLASVNAGAWIVIQQYFWQAFSQANSGGVWTYGDPGNREYSFTYLRKVLSKDASGITLDAPIPYMLNPANNTIYIKTSGTDRGMLENAGISGMTIQFEDNNNGTAANTREGMPSGCAVYFEGVVNGWVKDVSVINFPRYGILAEYSARITIEDCYVKKTQDYGGGGAGYGFYVNCSQNILIKRCHGEQARHNFILSRALSHYVVMTQCVSLDAAQSEDTHFGFSHALLRDKFYQGNGNAYNGYNRWTTSGNAYESYGTGANWNLETDGYGGQWHGGELNISPSNSGYAIQVGVSQNYLVHDGAGYPAGTYVVGTVINNNAGMQVGPASWRQNVLYEGVGYAAGLTPDSLFEEQLKNRVGIIADWENVCSEPALLIPVPTNTPVLTPGILVFDSEIPAFGMGLGSAASTPACTLTPGNNPNDAGQNRTINGAESFRLTTSSGDWGIVANFGGPDMNTADLNTFDGWVYLTDTNYNFRLQLQIDTVNTGSSVVVTAAYADGGTWTANQWNHFSVSMADFSYTGVFNGIGIRTGTLTAGKTAWFDDFYFLGNTVSTPTFTHTETGTETATETATTTATYTSTDSATNTATHTQTYTYTYTNTATHTATPTSTQNISLTGEILFSTDRDGNWEIYSRDLETGIETNLTNSPANELNPSVSADGLKAVFYGDADGDNDIYEINLTTLQVIKLTDNTASDYDPSYSLDGSKIVFKSNRDDGYGDIFVMSSDGTGQLNLTPLMNTTEEWDPCFTRDGTKIVFVSRLGAASDTDEIYMMASDGQGITRLTNNTVPDWYPSCSPLADEILFISKEPSDTDDGIYTMDYSGASRLALVQSAGDDNDPAYFDNGQKIIYINNSGGDYDIFIADSDGSNAALVGGSSFNELCPVWVNAAVVTFTPTATETDTHTYTYTQTFTSTDTPTYTHTNTIENTFTSTHTYTNTNTVQNTFTSTYTHTNTNTVQNTFTPAYTHTNTNTVQNTFTSTYTHTNTNTVQNTFTSTHTNTNTVQNTFTPTHSQTGTYTMTFTATYTNTASFTQTPTAVIAAVSVPDNDVYIYPNPFIAGKHTQINAVYSARSSHNKTRILLYTVSFRLIKEFEYTADRQAGINTVSVPAKKFNGLGNGAYYYVLTAESEGEIQRFKAGRIILLK